MKRIIWLFFAVSPAFAQGQGGFKPGYIIDKSGTRYEGLLKYEPGNEKKPGEVIFRESRNAKKEVYSTSYVRTFKIETDSFTVVSNIPVTRQKIRAADFMKVVLSGPGGVVYLLEYTVQKSSGHASTEYVNTVENTRYYIYGGGKLSPLTQSNFTAVAGVVADCQELKAKIAGKKLKLANLAAIVEEYRNCKSQ